MDVNAMATGAGLVLLGIGIGLGFSLLWPLRDCRKRESEEPAAVEKYEKYRNQDGLFSRRVIRDRK